MQGERRESAFWAWSQALMALVSTVLVIVALALVLALVVYLVIVVGSALVEQGSVLPLPLHLY